MIGDTDEMVDRVIKAITKHHMRRMHLLTSHSLAADRRGQEMVAQRGLRRATYTRDFLHKDLVDRDHVKAVKQLVKTGLIEEFDKQDEMLDGYEFVVEPIRFGAS